MTTDNAAPQGAIATASSEVDRKYGKVLQSEGSHSHPVPTREVSGDPAGAVPDTQETYQMLILECATWIRRLGAQIKQHNPEMHRKLQIWLHRKNLQGTALRMEAMTTCRHEWFEGKCIHCGVAPDQAARIVQLEQLLLNREAEIERLSDKFVEAKDDAAEWQRNYIESERQAMEQMKRVQEVAAERDVLRALLTEVTEAARRNWEQSPEGRAHLAIIDAALDAARGKA